jgi:hypothetical protein
MRVRWLMIAAAAAIAAPTVAAAQPNRFQLDVQVAPHKVAALKIGTVPQGEFAFALRAASDGEKRFRLTQQRNGGSAFTVLAAPSAQAASACQGAAGSLICTGITTPATPGNRTWTFRLRNQSNRPLSITLTIVWRRIASAGYAAS